MAHPLDILYVVTKANWGGAQRYVYDLALCMQDKGYVVAVAYGSPGVLSEKLQKAGIEAIPLASLSRDIAVSSEWKAFWSLLSLIRARRPHVLHLNSSKAGGLGALAGRLNRTKRIIFTAHGWAFNEDRPGWQKLLIEFFAGITILLSHETLCVSDAIREDMRTFPGASRKMRVVRSGVGSISFMERAAAREALLPGNSGGTWLGIIAELHPTKRVQDALQAFNLALKDRADTKLVVIGDGEMREALESRIRASGLEEQVFLVGFRSEAARYLPAFDLFLLPSRSEALAYVLLEAGQAGLPVIASRVGGIPEVVEHGVSGVLVPPSNPITLAAAIKEMLADSEGAKRYGEALRARVTEHFSLARMTDETLARYKL